MITLYFPTIHTNIDSILSSESISPLSTNEKGAKNMQILPRVDNYRKDVLVLFDKIPAFYIENNGMERYPMVVALEVDERQVCFEQEKDGVKAYFLSETSYIDPYNCKFIFFEDIANDLARMMISESLNNKLGVRFKREIVKNGEFKLDVFAELEIAVEEIPAVVMNDKKKGLLWGYILGCHKNQSLDINFHDILDFNNNVIQFKDSPYLQTLLLYIYDGKINNENLNFDKINILTSLGPAFKKHSKDSADLEYFSHFYSFVSKFEKFDFNETNDICIKSIALFIYRGNDYNELITFCEEKKLADYRYVCSLWGALFGYSKLPKTILNDEIMTATNVSQINHVLFNLTEYDEFPIKPKTWPLDANVNASDLTPKATQKNEAKEDVDTSAANIIQQGIDIKDEIRNFANGLSKKKTT